MGLGSLNWVCGLLTAVLGIFMACSISTETRHRHTHKQNDQIGIQSYYACPQHPEIKQYNPGLCSICRTDMVRAGGLVWKEKTDEEFVFW